MRAAASRSRQEPSTGAGERKGDAAATDWAEVSARLAQGDPVAHVKVSSVVMGMLVRVRAFDLEPLWEDICQDVLTALVQSVQRGALRAPQAFVAYCGVITRNKVLQRRRQAWSERARSAAAQADELPEPSCRAHDPGLRIDLERALAALPERMRAVLQAIYLEGRSYQDAALALGVPLGTLKRMQTQGLRRMRERVCA
jgi:RNA polymerase sigma-70 factor (ECF subfamily)